MARSMKSNISVGNIKAIWNSATKHLEYFKRSTRGRFIICNPYTGRIIGKGPGITKIALDKLTEN